MEEVARSPDDFASAFESAFARVQIEVEEASSAQRVWPAKVAAGIRAGIEIAARDPAAANLLTNEALGAGPDGIARYRRLLGYIAEALAPGREHRSSNTELPQLTEQGIAGGLVGFVAQRLAQGEAIEPRTLTPDAIQFALTPYLGVEEAKRIASAYVWPRSRPDR